MKESKLLLDWLKTKEQPTILHVIIDNRLQHYIICYGYKNERFIIGDPAKGICLFTPNELNEIWKSNNLLVLSPNEYFKKASTVKNEKKYWFFNLVKSDITLLTVISILGLAVSFLGLTMVIFTQQLIDKILPHADRQKLILGLCLLCVLQLFRSLIGYIRGQFLNMQNRDFNNRLIDKFYGTLLYLPKTFFSNRKIGELVARMEDTSRIQTVLAFVFGDLVKDLLLVIVSLAFVFWGSTSIRVMYCKVAS